MNTQTKYGYSFQSAALKAGSSTVKLSQSDNKLAASGAAVAGGSSLSLEPPELRPEKKAESSDEEAEESCAVNEAERRTLISPPHQSRTPTLEEVAEEQEKLL